MLHYIALVHKDKTSAFGVQFPNVPGCFSAADDTNDLVANATEALSLWAGDEAFPSPRSIDALKKDKTIRRELVGGLVSANSSLERGVLKAIDVEAKRRKLTRSAFLAQAAKRELVR